MLIRCDSQNDRSEDQLVQHANQHPLKSALWWAAFTGALFLAGVGVGIVSYTVDYNQRALPGVHVGRHLVAGMTHEEIIELVNRSYSSTEVTIDIGGKTTTVPLKETGVRVDAEATADAALANNGTINAAVHSLFLPTVIAPVISTDPTTFNTFSDTVNELTGSAPTQGSVVVATDGNSLISSPATAGRGAQDDQLRSVLHTAAQDLMSTRVNVPEVHVDPRITTEEAEEAAKAANELVSAAVEIVTPKETITASPADKVKWVSVTEVDGTLNASLNVNEINTWIDNVFKTANRNPINGINNVDASGQFIALARPAKPGVALTNEDNVRKEILDAIKSSTPIKATLTYNEVPAAFDSRVVPSGPERFAHRPRPGEKWVDVNLTDSTLTAYVGHEVVYGPILINHGGVGHETVTGTFHVYLKYDKQDMGCTPEWSYCEKDVPWVSYWHGSYALHGAPWVKEFGIGTDESSHGCINIPVSDSQWLWNWAEMGTTVVTHR